MKANARLMWSPVKNEFDTPVLEQEERGEREREREREKQCERAKKRNNVRENYISVASRGRPN